jgi:hypothetical protein
MTGERIALHSDIGRLQLRIGIFLFWPAFVASLLACLFAVVQLHASPWSLLLAVVALPFFLLTRWTARNATRVFATPAGLELTDQHRIIPWSSVAEARQVAFPNLIPIYRITFSDGSPPLTFLTSQHIQPIIARFKAPTSTP